MASRIWIFGVGRQVEFELKQRIFEHLLKLEPAYFSTNPPGDLITRTTSDVEKRPPTSGVCSIKPGKYCICLFYDYTNHGID